jgi:hypothetical protein
MIFFLLISWFRSKNSRREPVDVKKTGQHSNVRNYAWKANETS